jgi:hypothetical protein
VTPTPIGITADRSVRLDRFDPTWLAYRERCIGPCNSTSRIDALNEGLTAWRASRIYYQPPVWWMAPGEWEPTITEPRLHHYETIIHTPPGRPEWLELVTERD